jgi:hypothetical protein
MYGLSEQKRVLRTPKVELSVEAEVDEVNEVTGGNDVG